MTSAPPLRAVIFDFNGVILDDEHVHFDALAELLGRHAVHLSRDAYYSRYLGLDDRACLGRIFTDLGSPAQRASAQDPDWVWSQVEIKSDLYMQRIQGHTPVFEGIPDLVAELAGSLPLAIASGARRREVEAALVIADLGEHFFHLVTADDVLCGKPNPAPFTRAYELLRDDEPAISDLLPAQCLVFEDSPLGVQAAHAAGMRCIAVTTGNAAASLATADAVVDTLSGLNVREAAMLAGFSLPTSSPGRGPME